MSKFSAIGESKTSRGQLASNFFFHICIWGMSIVIFMPYILGNLISLRVFIVALGFFVLVMLIHRSNFSPRTVTLCVVFSALYIGLVSLLIGLVAQLAGDPSTSLNSQRLFIVTPLFLIIGGLSVKSNTFTKFARVFLVIGTLCALAAVMERILGYSVVGRVDFISTQREGSVRAIFLSENVLVFGAILASIIPLVTSLRTRLAVPLAVVLVAGSWATGSRGPTIAAVIITIIGMIAPLRRSLQYRYRSIRILIFILILVILFLAFSVWTTEVRGATGLEYSFWYRPAIYAFLPLILSARPLGYMLGTVPPGTWLMPTELRGVRDASVSFDSELVYSAFSFGWLGIILFVLAILIATAAIRYDFRIGASALLVSLSGLFLALHAWDSLGPFWYFFLGASIFSIYAGRLKRRESVL